MRDSSPFSFLKSKFRVANPDPRPLASSSPSSKDIRGNHRQRPRHASVDSYHHRHPSSVPHPSRLYESFELHDSEPRRSLEEGGNAYVRPLLYRPLERNDDDGDGTAASQFRFIQQREEHNHPSTRRGSQRRASVPVRTSASGPTLNEDGVLPRLTPLDVKAQQLSQLIQQISDPHSHTNASSRPPRPLSPKRKRVESHLPPPPSPHVHGDTQLRAPPRLVFDALARVDHIGGRGEVGKVLNLHGWMMVRELDGLDREERDAVRVRDAEDVDGMQEEKEGAKGTSYERKKVFGVALRHISVYASTDVLLSSTSSTFTSPTSSTSRLASTPARSAASQEEQPLQVQGHTLSLPIVLVSTIEELYRTGLYTPSLFRILPSPLRLRELVSVFNHYDLAQVEETIIVTPRPRARERGLSTRFGGSVSLHMEGVGEVGSVLSTWVGAVPGGVVGIEAYLKRDTQTQTAKRRGSRESASGDGAGGWWKAVWEWCRIDEDESVDGKLGINAVSEIAKIHTAQLLLHLLPQPAFDALVYLLAFFSQVVLVGKTNGVGVGDVGGMFGRGVFGEPPSTQGGKETARNEREGAKQGAKEKEGGDGDGRSERMMVWFLRRWDRISSGLFDVPKRLVEEQELLDSREGAVVPPTVSHDGGSSDVEASSTYTYRKDVSSEGRDGGSGSVSGVADAACGRKMEVYSDVRTVPLSLANMHWRMAGKERGVDAGGAVGAREDERGRRRVDVSLERGRGRGKRERREGEVEGGVLREPRSNPGERDSHIRLAQRCSRYRFVDLVPLNSPSPPRVSLRRRLAHEPDESGRYSEQSLLSEGPPNRFFEDREVAKSPMEYENGEGRRVVVEDTSLWEYDDMLVSHMDKLARVRPRLDTDATIVVREGEEETRTPKASMSMDEMLDDMMKSYEVLDAEPPAMDDSLRTMSPLPGIHSSTPPASVVLPLHLKPKLTAQSLLDELRQESLAESPGSSPRSMQGIVVVKTPVMELYRSESGTFSVSSTSDLRARLMDVTIDSDDELHAGLVLQSSTPRIPPPYNLLQPPKHQDRRGPRSPVRHNEDRSTSRRVSKRSSVYDLEAELNRVKEQNDQAMGALEEATKQIHDLEERLRGSGAGGDKLKVTGCYRT